MIHKAAKISTTNPPPPLPIDIDIDIDIDSIFPKIRTRQCHVKLFESISIVR
jgi:hypothetical protein